MNPIMGDAMIAFANQFQLPERVVNIDQLPWVAFDDGTCHFKPLRFDLNSGGWIYLFKIKSNQTLSRHRHTGGTVIGYTIQGTWRYQEQSWVARPGTFIYEPAGDIHTLITEDEEVITLFILSGALQYFDETNQLVGQDDVYTVLKKYRDHCTAHNIAFKEELIY